MPHNNLGLIYLSQGRYDEAIYELKTAIMLDPNYINAHSNLGFAYLRQGRKDEAIAEFTIALKLKPDYKEAYGNLEVLTKGKKDYKDAGNVTAIER